MDRPILFSAPMVRAIIREIERPGTGKTQTRRILKPQPDFSRHHLPVRPESRGGRRWVFMCRTDFQSYGWATADFMAPCEVGDRLWVREAHYITDDGDYEHAVYSADENGTREHLASIDALPAYFSEELRKRHKRLRPGIHMPRWASRITLLVEDVKIERLQAISEEDSLKEGICRTIAEIHGDGRKPTSRRIYSSDPNFNFAEFTARRAFQLLWHEIDGAASWQANPWVVAISFRPVLANIDSIGALAA